MLERVICDSGIGIVFKTFFQNSTSY